MEIKVAKHGQILDKVLTLHSMGLSEITEKEWRWKHLDNPFVEGEPEIIVAVDGNTIVAANCFTPLWFVVEGKRTKAIQSSDTIVHPEYRGRQIFSQLLTYAERYYKDRGYEFAFGFPNQNSLPGFMKQGWKSIMAITQLNYVLDWRKVLQNFLPGLPFKTPIGWMCNGFFGLCRTKRFSQARVVQVFSGFPDIMNKLDGLYRRKSIEIMRTKEYMEWRLDQHPHGRFHYIIATDQEHLLWYAIVDVIKDPHGLMSGRIADYAVRNEDEGLFGEAILASMKFLMKQQCDRIIILQPTQLRWRNVLGKLGFEGPLELLLHRLKRLKNKFEPCLIVKPLQDVESALNLLDSSKWSPTLIYHDVL